MKHAIRLSVVIPTLNEAADLAETIRVLRARTAGPPIELIVANCASVDDTQAVALRCGAHVVSVPPPADRALACNAGGAAAMGDVVLFLHADSHVPQQYDAQIREALLSPDVVGGAFEFRLDGTQWRLRLVEWVNRLRYRLRGRFFGDQGIFILRRTFEVIGGFPTVGILEDAHFCASARRVGVMRLIDSEMLTSPRRFYAGGILRTLALDVFIVLTDLLGLDAARFADTYRRDNARRGLGWNAHARSDTAPERAVTTAAARLRQGWCHRCAPR